MRPYVLQSIVTPQTVGGKIRNLGDTLIFTDVTGITLLSISQAHQVARITDQGPERGHLLWLPQPYFTPLCHSTTAGRGHRRCHYHRWGRDGDGQKGLHYETNMFYHFFYM